MSGGGDARGFSVVADTSGGVAYRIMPDGVSVGGLVVTGNDGMLRFEKVMF